MEFANAYEKKAIDHGSFCYRFLVSTSLVAIFEPLRIRLKRFMLGPAMRQVLLILVINSACATSVLRTYYTWRVVASHDTSWELLPMELWTWAELSIGIIVGCLPALPKFFRHIGTKIHLKLRGSGTERAASVAAHPPKANFLASVKRPFGKYGVGRSVTDSWNDPYIPRSQHREEYVVLDEFDATPLQEEPLNAPTEWPGHGIATIRRDLENAQEKQ